MFRRARIQKMFGFSSCDIIVNLQKSCFRREKQMKARLKQTTNRREKRETERKRRIKKKVLEIMGEEGTNKKKWIIQMTKKDKTQK